SSSTSASPCLNASAEATVWAFMLPGRLSVSVATPSARSRRRVSSFGFVLISFPLPDRRTLFGEGPRAFLGVLGLEHRTRDLALPIPLLAGGPAGRLGGHTLAARGGERAVGGDCAGELERLIERAAGRGQVIDQAVAVGILRRQHVAGEDV